MALMSLGVTRLTWQRLALGAALLLWVVICARQVYHQFDHPGKIGIAVCALLLLSPLFLLNVARMPIYLLAGYAALVPFDNLLVTGAGASVTKAIGALAGGSLVLSMLVMKRAIKPSRSILIILALMLYVGATIFWAIDSSRALTTYGTYVNFFLLFAAISLYPITRNGLTLVFAAAICGAMVAAAYGDYTFHQGQVAESRLMMGGNDRYYVDPNEFAAGLLMPIALALMMFLRCGFNATKLLWLGVLVVLCSGFVLSGSRGGSISLAAICLFLFFRSRYKTQLLAVALAVTAAIFASPIGQRFGQSDVATADLRVDIWKVGIVSLRQYWLGGAGVGNFQNAFTQYFLATPHQPLLWIRTAHSMFVLSAVEYGILGLLLVLSVWYYQFRELAHVQGDDRAVDLCTALSAGIVGLFVIGFSLDLMTYKYTWLAFAFIALMRNALVTSGVSVALKNGGLRKSRTSAVPVPSHGMQ